MSLNAIEAFLSQKTGLNPTLLGQKAFMDNLRKRMQICGVSQFQDYFNYIKASQQEFDALVEAIVVPETWFFRDREPFTFLKQYVQTQWLRANPFKKLRVLSVPCSTGEEPYSIAMALLDSGLTHHQFHIDAVDISQQALAVAQQGLYDRYSFRNSGATFRTHYFEPTASGYRLSSLVRNTVHLMQGNLLNPLFLCHREPYDAIFCRNLLIYLHTSAKEEVLCKLEQLLTVEGLLFVGHAEMGLVSRTHFVAISHPFSFAFQHRSQAHSQSNQSVQSVDIKSDDSSVSPPVSVKPQTPAIASQKPDVLPDTPALESVQLLANQGKLLEAQQSCERYLSINPTDADAYALMGQIKQATNQEVVAEQCFQKALYLNPKHLNALRYLVLSKEKQGDAKQVRLLRERIQRLITFYETDS